MMYNRDLADIAETIAKRVANGAAVTLDRDAGTILIKGKGEHGDLFSGCPASLFDHLELAMAPCKP